MNKETKSSQQFSNEREVKKARKEHTCCSCNKKIPTKSSYVRTVGVAESNRSHGNSFFSHAWHKECLENHQGYIRDSLRRQG